MKKGLYKTLSPQELTDKVCVIVGTRPGIIKMSPLIKELRKRKAPSFVIHTGQHYSYNMDATFFADLELPPADYRVERVKKGGLHGEQTARMLEGIEKFLLREKPACVLVCGDANTNLAGALAARKLNISVGHVEAGLRSRDWRMPEEHNRVMIDHISDYLFAPTKECVENLKRENVIGKIVLSGNTIVDSVITHRYIAQRKSTVLNDMGIRKKQYAILTSHREENVDSPEGLTHLIEIVKSVTKAFDLPLVFPIHPRTRKNLSQMKMLPDVKKIRNLHIIEPLGYLDFLCLLNNASVVITDSGGIQEESCILKTPCVTIRDNTERPETVRVGANILTGLSPQKVLKAVAASLAGKREWPNPFGKGNSAKIIIDTVLRDV